MISSRIALFFGLFIILVAPWTGLDGAYCAWIRALGGATFARGHPEWEVRFEPIQRTRERPLDTRIVLVDQRQRTPGGRLRASLLDLDMRGIGWVPTAFFAALVLATPVPWARRGRALAWGIFPMHAFVLLSIGIHIVSHLDGGGGLVLDGLDETLINQMGAGFFLATFIWILATFRPGDWEAIAVRLGGVQPSNPGTKSDAAVKPLLPKPNSIESRGRGRQRRPTVTSSPPGSARSFPAAFP
jgi:hypothetical protein